VAKEDAGEDAGTLMILTCPSCRTRYQADGTRFPSGGRNVRCGKCGQVWFQPMPDAASEAEVVVSEPPPASATKLVQPSAGSSGFEEEGPSEVAPPKTVEAPAPAVPRPSHVQIAQIAGWAVLIMMVVGIGWSAVQYRQFIANVWPESASVYAALGMPVNVRGMALTNISYKQDIEDGLPVLSVTGKVVNISNHELPVPMLRAVLTDDSKREVYRWTFSAGLPTLQAGAEGEFSTRLSSPPPEARNLNITFAEAGD
jgi:predicted Zn finger-like uncharacterized protein